MKRIPFELPLEITWNFEVQRQGLPVSNHPREHPRYGDYGGTR